MNKIKNLFISFYLVYIMCFFKTKLCFNTIWNKKIQANYDYKLLKHSIDDNLLSNKVCPFGHIISILFAIWIYFRICIKNQKWRTYINNTLWIIYILGGLLLNLNVFIYILPVFLIDYF